MMKHKHLIIRAEVDNPPQKENLETMNDWFRELIEKIDMEILLGPYSVYCDQPGNEGFTSICAITTSSITIHTWNDPAIVQLDVYSCKDFDMNIVIDHLNIFSPNKIQYKFIDRENGLTEL